MAARDFGKIKSDWMKIRASNYWGELNGRLMTERLKVLTRLEIISNDRDTDCYLKGQLEGLEIIGRVIDRLTKEIEKSG